MSERLRESVEGISTPKSPSVSQLYEHVDQIAQEIEQLDVETTQPSEVVKDSTSEQWAATGAQGTSTTATKSVKGDMPIPLPTTIEELRKVVKKEIMQEIRTLQKDAQKVINGRDFSAYKMNELGRKLRSLKGFLRKLVTFSVDKLKEVLFAIVPAGKYIDTERERNG